MAQHQRAKLLKQTTGIAGLITMLLPAVGQARTLDFTDDGDSYQVARAANPDARDAKILHDGASTGSNHRATKAEHEPAPMLARYRERSRFDGRGAIIDLVS